MLCSINSDLELWLMNHAWIHKNYELNVFKNTFFGENLLIEWFIDLKQLFTIPLNHGHNYC